ncbi:MAG: hypothetical protein AAF587_15340 [Bacteroidota bacterium]
MDHQQPRLSGSPLSQQIVQTDDFRFLLWLEWEENMPHRQIEDDYADIVVDMLDGRTYWITVWTYAFLQEVVKYDIAEQEGGKGLFVVPPDLFVQTLTRECLEETILALMREGDLDRMLNPSVFRLKYAYPWIDSYEFDETRKVERTLFGIIGAFPRFYGHMLHVLAKNVEKNEYALQLEHRGIAVIPFPKENLAETDIQFFKNKKDFWARKLRYELPY